MKQDWDSVISLLVDGEVRSYGVDFYLNTDGRFNDIIDLWKQAGYDKAGTVEWINFYPGRHFDEDIVNDFETYTGTSCAKAWISCVMPGKYAPYHQDIDDHEDSYLKQGTLERYTCHISKPEFGQVFIVEDQVYANQEQGTIHKWPTHRAWHAGGNCSFKPKHIFNYLGIKK